MGNNRAGALGTKRTLLINLRHIMAQTRLHIYQYIYIYISSYSEKKGLFLLKHNPHDLRTTVSVVDGIKRMEPKRSLAWPSAVATATTQLCTRGKQKLMSLGNAGPTDQKRDNMNLTSARLRRRLLSASILVVVLGSSPPAPDLCLSTSLA